MRNRIYLTILLAGLMLIVSACQEDPSISVSPQTPETMPNKIAMGETGYDDPVLHDVLESVWDDNNGTIRQLFMQAVNPADGDTFSVTPNGWSEGYVIRIAVPAGALPAGDPVGVGVAIPVNGVQGIDTPTYEFFPHGVTFNSDIHVTVCWPEWAGPPPGTSYDVIFVDQDWHEGVRHYKISDIESAQPQAVIDQKPDEILTVFQLSTEITFKLGHFSRWGVTSGTDDGDGFLPGTGDNGLQIGDGCWMNYEDPFIPRPGIE